MKVFLTMAALILFAAPGYAQTILKYIDSAGVTHYVQSEDQIPPEYRAGVTTPKNMPPVTPTDPGISDRSRQELRLRRELEDQQLRHRRELEDAQRSRADAEARFNQAAAACAQHSKVKIIIKPQTRINIMGTTEQRWAFDECMSQSGQHTEGAR